MDFMSTREPGNLSYIVMLFVLSENFRQLKQAATNTPMERLLPCLLGQRTAVCTLPTLFPAAQHPNDKRTCAFAMHKPLPLSCQSHHQLRQEMLFGAECPAWRQPWTAVGVPSRSFTTFHFCSNLVEQGGRETTVCICFGIPTKRSLKLN